MVLGARRETLRFPQAGARGWDASNHLMQLSMIIGTNGVLGLFGKARQTATHSREERYMGHVRASNALRHYCASATEGWMLLLFGPDL